MTGTTSKSSRAEIQSIQLFNGRVMSALIDDDTNGRKMQGEIGIQLHRLPNAAMKMETRNIRLKTF